MIDDVVRTADSDLCSFETGDGHLVYRDTGVGQPVVLLHGGFLDHRMWDDQVPALAARYRVIAPDTRGHGGSANASRLFRQADDVAALLRHLELGPAVLVGLSMGGGIAVDTALEYPELVRAVVVSGVGTSEPDFQHPWFIGVFTEWERALRAGDIEAWLAAFMLLAAGPHRSLDEVPGEIVSRLRQMGRTTIGKHTAAEPDWRMPVRDTWQRAAQIAVPVLAINGAIDGDDNLRMAERLTCTVADGRTTTIEGTGHYPNMERPALFNRLLGEFLDAL
ncbi:alpha/beta fold hydrolase [Kitasatospora kifunensis]|uniref:Pimeloyl-ACP methyl ester carboxylesterase n=1 Tax=Kitasatospora kifunensis TaxID=58351 RepID=A0A7W7QX86_KITKI|nr:alpha/beta hydrolase [Kitasatospora kifunensis]MBB4921437.1 pimeloyl-ACP methyl ester carboxylesterase [Kitasatospora kifunensis]